MVSDDLLVFKRQFLFPCNQHAVLNRLYAETNLQTLKTSSGKCRRYINHLTDYIGLRKVCGVLLNWYYQFI